MLTLQTSAFGVPEAMLSKDWRQIYGDWQSKNCSWASYQSTSGKKSGYARCGRGRRPVVIMPGYSEPALKYIETVFDLQQADPEVGPFYIWELPGQGTSDRLGSTPVLVHVDTSSRYIDDFLNFIDIELKRSEYSKPILIAHSTGALVAMVASLRRSGEIAGVIALSPLVRPNLPLPPWSVSFIAGVYNFFGYGMSSVWGQSSKPIEHQTFESNQSTDSKIRWTVSHTILVENQNLFSHGISWDWLGSTLKLGDELLNGKDRIKSKIVMIKPEQDFYVSGVDSEKLCKSITRCESSTISGDKHETLQLTDTKRDGVMATILSVLTTSSGL